MALAVFTWVSMPCAGVCAGTLTDVAHWLLIIMGHELHRLANSAALKYLPPHGRQHPVLLSVQIQRVSGHSVSGN